MKLIATLSLSLFLFTAHAQISVPQKNKTLVLMYAESTSNDCGTYGWDTFRELVDSNLNAVFANWYGSGDAKLTVSPIPLNASILQIHVPAVGFVPSFLVNGTNLGYVQYSGVKSFIQSNTSGPVIANTGFTQNTNSTGDSLVIDTRTKFFQNASGEFYVATYVYEDTVIAPQTGKSSNAKHIRVWRTPLGIEGSFGSLLRQSSFSSGYTFDTTYRIYIDPSWQKDKLHVFTVIWEKKNGFYTVLNAHELRNSSVGINDISTNTEISHIYPNPVINEIQMKLNGHGRKCLITITDMSGRVVSTLHKRNDNNNLLIERHQTLSSGLYFITISSDQKVETQKILLK